MIRCSKPGCKAESKPEGRELGWLWDWRLGWRCPKHRSQQKGLSDIEAATIAAAKANHPSIR